MYISMVYVCVYIYIHIHVSQGFCLGLVSVLGNDLSAFTVAANYLHRSSYLIEKMTAVAVS